MKKFFWSAFEIFETIIIAVAAVFLIRTFIAQPFLVSGASMEPTFSNGNYLLIDELTYRFREPERGEVVVFRYPADPSSFFIKRIIGLPGEKIIIENGIISIIAGGENKILTEPYIWRHKTGGRFETTLGVGQYFVLGDNRDASFDSRSWGPLNRENIVGLVRLRLWPFNEVTAFASPHYGQ